MAIDYYSKYLKYKSKYLELKAQMGRGKEFCFSCSCNKFVGNTDMGPCGNCKHDFSLHSRKPREAVKVKSEAEILANEQKNEKIREDESDLNAFKNAHITNVTDRTKMIKDSFMADREK